MSNKRNGSLFERIAAVIVGKRSIIFLVYIGAIIFSLFSMNWVQVENDVTTYLPEDTETRQGLVAMNENFVTFGSAQVMISNVTYETADSLCAQIADIDGVAMVTFDDIGM